MNSTILSNIAHPRRWLNEVCGGQSAYPLIVLFGLNAVDELDRTAFGILLPNIRDEFGINLTTALALVALSSIAALALQVKTRLDPLATKHEIAWI